MNVNEMVHKDSRQRISVNILYFYMFARGLRIHN